MPPTAMQPPQISPPTDADLGNLVMQPPQMGDYADEEPQQAAPTRRHQIEPGPATVSNEEIDELQLQETDNSDPTQEEIDAIQLQEAEARKMGIEPTVGEEPQEGPLAFDFTTNPPPGVGEVPEFSQGGANRALLLRQIFAESSGNRHAKGKDRNGNPSSARGLMQLLDGTGREVWNALGRPFGPYDPTNDEQNVLLGTTYLNKQLEDFNWSTRLALAAYKQGPAKIREARRKAIAGLGDGSWEATRQYLSENDRFEVDDYLKKIMGTDEERAQANTVTPDDRMNALDSLGPEGKARAKAGLTPQGMMEMVKSYVMPEQSSLADYASMLLAPVQSINAEGLEKGAEIAAPVLSKLLPDSLQSFALGVARMQLFGFDDEAGALLRMAVLHEDYETAKAASQAIRQSYIQKTEKDSGHWFIPNGPYGLGELAGAIAPGPATAVRGVKAGAGVALGKMGVTDAVKWAAKPAMERLGKKGAGIVSQALSGAAEGGIAGAAMGAGEGEGLIDSATKAVKGGLLGATIGTIFGAGAGIASNAVNSRAAKNLLKKAIAQADDKELRPLTAAEERIATALRGMSFDERMEALAKMVGEEDLKLIDALGASNLKEALDMWAKTPTELGGRLRNTARARSAGTKTTPPKNTGGIPRPVGGVIGRTKQALLKIVPTYNSESPGALSRHLTGTRDKMDRALTDLSKKFFGAAERSLPTVNSKWKESAVDFVVPAEKVVGQPSRQLLYDAAGAPLSREARISNFKKGFEQIGPGGKRFAGDLPEAGVPGERTIRPDFDQERVPVFVSDEVQALFSDPEVVGSGVIQDAWAEVGKAGTLPKNSFPVMQRAKQIANESMTAARKSRDFQTAREWSRIARKLKSALHGESPEYEAADKMFSEGKTKIGEFTTRSIRDLMKLTADDELLNAATIGKKLLSMDASVIKGMMSKLDAEGRKLVRETFAQHIANTMDTMGTPAAGQTRVFPKELTTEKLYSQLEAVFSPIQAQKIWRRLEAEQMMNATDNLIQGLGSQTIPRLFEAADTAAKKTLNFIAGGARLLLFKLAGIPGTINNVVHMLDRDPDIAAQASELAEKLYFSRPEGLKALKELSTRIDKEELSDRAIAGWIGGLNKFINMIEHGTVKGIPRKMQQDDEQGIGYGLQDSPPAQKKTLP